MAVDPAFKYRKELEESYTYAMQALRGAVDILNGEDTTEDAKRFLENVGIEDPDDARFEVLDYLLISIDYRDADYTGDAPAFDFTMATGGPAYGVRYYVGPDLKPYKLLFFFAWWSPEQTIELEGRDREAALALWDYVSEIVDLMEKVE